MLLQNLRARVGARIKGNGESGFTLIELLVVMLILGILAAIALPAFFNQKDKAGDAKAKEYVHSAQVAMETYYTDKGTYVGATKAELVKIEPTISSATFVEAPTVSATGYTIKIQGTKTTQKFWVTNAAGTLTFECEEPGVGGCPSAAAGATKSSWG